MELECTRCMIAKQDPEPADQALSKWWWGITDVFDFGEEAVIIYSGEGLCLSHFNTVRGHAPFHGGHNTPGNRRWRETHGI